MRPHERWIWVELIGFDVEQPDLGVGDYLDRCGFAPHTICLLLTSPDFVLSHEDQEGEVVLPPDYCARDGHEFGRDRQRQQWTNRQLQRLIALLHERGVRVFLTVFTAWYRDRYHPEWLAGHHEVFMVFRERGVGYAINPIARLADGSYFQDYWARKLVQTLQYYGFDGWQGADGWGPLSGPIYYVDFSDDTVTQFADWLGRGRRCACAHSRLPFVPPSDADAVCPGPDARKTTSGHAAPPGEAAPVSPPSRGSGVSLDPLLPDCVLAPWEDDLDRLEARADWLWRHARSDWIAFWSDRWAGFWRTVLQALHAVGKEAVINSAWGRAPFEALYRYGVDYRKIAAAGVDGMIVETVAAGLSLDPRAADDKRHFDFLSMFALVRAYLPDLRLIFLHNAHDIVEQWDALRHVPAVLEKEIFALTNVYHISPHTEGAGHAQAVLQPAADGFLVCLGDGFTREEWAWLERRWQFSLSQAPRRVVGATLVWSDAAMQAEVEDFTLTRRPLSHRLLYELMAQGAPVGATIRVEDLALAEGPLLVLNLHHFPEAEQEALLAYPGPVLAVGGQPSIHSAPPRSLREGFTAHTFAAPPIYDLFGLKDQRGYWDHLVQRLPGEAYFKECAAALWELVMPGVGFPAEEVTLSLLQLDSGALRVALKSKSWIYCKPRIDLGREIGAIEVVTEFPSVRIRPEGSCFEVRLPPRGLVVLDVTFAR